LCCLPRERACRAAQEFEQFPALKDRIVEAASGLVHRFVPATQQLVTQLVEMELAYINLGPSCSLCNTPPPVSAAFHGADWFKRPLLSASSVAVRSISAVPPLPPSSPRPTPVSFERASPKPCCCFGDVAYALYLPVACFFHATLPLALPRSIRETEPRRLRRRTEIHKHESTANTMPRWLRSIPKRLPHCVFNTSPWVLLCSLVRRESERASQGDQEV